MTVKELAQVLQGVVQGDGSREINGVAGLEDAAPDKLAFAEGERALAQACHSRAGCILVPNGTELPSQTVIAVSHAKWAFVRAAEILCPPPVFVPGVHSTAVIAPDAELATDILVGPYVVIERGAKVGSGTRLGAGCVIGENVVLGSQCVIYPRVTLYPGTRIGNRVILHVGVVVGSDGFGYVFAEGRHHKFPQLGEVIIEDDVEIGSNTTIDRGSLGTTVIGAGTKIDNLVQVAHNVHIGRHCVIAAEVGISGSVAIGDYVVIAGQAGIGEKARIEDQAVIGGGAAVPTGKIIRRGLTVWGIPARPLDEFKKIYAQFSQLPKLAEKVKKLSQSQAGVGKQESEDRQTE